MLVIKLHFQHIGINLQEKQSVPFERALHSNLERVLTFYICFAFDSAFEGHGNTYGNTIHVCLHAAHTNKL